MPHCLLTMKFFQKDANVLTKRTSAHVKWKRRCCSLLNLEHNASSYANFGGVEIKEKIYRRWEKCRALFIDIKVLSQGCKCTY